MRRPYLMWLFVVLLALAACGQESVAPGFPSNAVQPQPVTKDFQGCPPDGDGGDRTLNQLKNRVDDGNNGQYYDVDLGTLISLPYPQDVGRVARDNWSASDVSAIDQYEGVPVRAIGYMLNIKHEGTESTNCHSTDFRDYHTWVAPDPSDDRSASIVAEVTPRMQAIRSGWDSDSLAGLVGKQVRISGWLLMDQEHPEQIGQTRATLWEIHPITHIEVNNGVGWESID
jgi:hypothetical protein